MPGGEVHIRQEALKGGGIKHTQCVPKHATDAATASLRDNQVLTPSPLSQTVTIHIFVNDFQNRKKEVDIKFRLCSNPATHMYPGHKFNDKLEK